jgi:hypothetical protein
MIVAVTAVTGHLGAEIVKATTSLLGDSAVIKPEFHFLVQHLQSAFT